MTLSNTVSWVKILYRNGDMRTRGFDSKKEALDFYKYLIGNPRVEHLEICDMEPKT